MKSVLPQKQRRSQSRGKPRGEGKYQSFQSQFKVCVRARPLLPREHLHNPRPEKTGNTILVCDDRAVTIVDPDQFGDIQKHFNFDCVFSERSTNLDVFSALLQPALAQVREGFNVTCFAYGMTGAGKTHTMFGDRSEMGLADLCV